MYFLRIDLSYKDGTVQRTRQFVPNVYEVLRVLTSVVSEANVRLLQVKVEICS